MIKVKTYKLRKSGKRGVVLSLPKTWLDDLNLKPADEINIFRDDMDNLILKANKRKASHG